MREEFLLRAARRALESASPEDRARFERIIRELCSDPSAAEQIPALADEDVEPVYRYSEDEYYVTFDLPDEATVRVWIVGKGPPQRWRRRE